MDETATRHGGEVKKIRTLLTKEYIEREYSFTKRQLLESQLQIGLDGNQVPWKWAQERLLNEAKALQIVIANTDIRVPRLFDSGIDDQGRAFVEVEYIDGVELGNVGEKCRMPASGRKAHVPKGKPCDVCARIADSNADNYITNKVLPQLRQLRSNQTGLEGFVLPPPRISETIRRDRWQSIESPDGNVFSLIHGDLNKYNIMVNVATLEVISIFDWETSGYYPAAMEVAAWRMSFAEYRALFEDRNRIEMELGWIVG